MTIRLKSIYRLNEIPIKIPTQFLKDLERTILKFICIKKITQDSKTILNHKRSSGGIIIPNIKRYYRTVVIKIAWHWYQVEHWSKTEDEELNPHHYDHFTFDKGVKAF